MKDQCFFTLYTYRGLPTNENFVKALNAIPLLFSSNTEIMDSWREMINWLNNHGESKANVENWTNRAGEIRLKLISRISNETSHGAHDENNLKNDTYVPQSFSENYKLFTMIPESLKRIADALDTQNKRLASLLASNGKSNVQKKETESCEQ